MATNAASVVRRAIIDRLKADAGVRATALGASPRIFGSAGAPPGTAFPFVVVRLENAPNDTKSDRGAALDIRFYLEGDYEGDKEARAIFEAFRQSLRTGLAPAQLSGHELSILEWQFESVTPDPDEGAKRYAGMQRWRALTSEI